MGHALEYPPGALEKVLYFRLLYRARTRARRSLEMHQLLSETEYQYVLTKYQADETGKPPFRVGIGAEAVREMLREIDLDVLAAELRQELADLAAKSTGRDSEGQKRQRIVKRLEVVEAFRQSGNKPEWMILEVVPVIPPELRPMVQLDGGRFATSDLNDLYRRVINRNNRLNAPAAAESAGYHRAQRKAHAAGSGGRADRQRPPGPPGHRRGQPLRSRSLSDMLRGKQGRFRQNLLGKRVDYSGRSVIVVGPDAQDVSSAACPRRWRWSCSSPLS